MEIGEMKRRSRQVFEELWNKGNLDFAAEIVTPDFVARNAGFNGGFGEIHGPEGVKGLVTMFRAAFPDLRATVDDQVAEGDKVANLVRFSGTHQGELMGIPPTGRQFAIDVFVVQYYSGNKIVAVRSVFDAAGLMRQLGIALTGAGT